MTKTQVKEKRACLSFFEEKKKSFQCVEPKNGGGKLNETRGGMVCGTTPHLSTFAILLTSSSSTQCDTSIFFWLSIGFISADILLCLIVLVIGDFIWRKRRDELKRQLQAVV